MTNISPGVVNMFMRSKGLRCTKDAVYPEDIPDPGGGYWVMDEEQLVRRLLLSIFKNSSYEPFFVEKRPLELTIKD